LVLTIHFDQLGREWLLEERKKIADEEDAVLQRRMKAYEALQQKE